MNEKAAREARLLNRIVGKLAKRGQGPQPHKLPRSVKRAWQAKNHRQRGRVSRAWRNEIAGHLAKRGILLNQDRAAIREDLRIKSGGSIDMRQWFRSLPRSLRNHYRRTANRHQETP